MKKNMGNADATIRLIVAALIILLWSLKVISGTLAIVLLIISAVFVVTSLVHYCPLYSPFGISTCKKKND